MGTCHAHCIALLSDIISWADTSSYYASTHLDICPAYMVMQVRSCEPATGTFVSLLLSLLPASRHLLYNTELRAVAGSKYELPKYVLSDPANLVSERDSKQQHAQNAQQVELVARRV